MGEWKDMNDAPRDGTDVLLSPIFGETCIGYWAENKKKWRVSSTTLHGHWDEEVSMDGWQPLPVSIYRHNRRGE